MQMNVGVQAVIYSVVNDSTLRELTARSLTRPIKLHIIDKQLTYFPLKAAGPDVHAPCQTWVNRDVFWGSKRVVLCFKEVAQFPSTCAHAEGDKKEITARQTHNDFHTPDQMNEDSKGTGSIA
jgi:hypothetical protein